MKPLQKLLYQFGILKIDQPLIRQWILQRDFYLLRMGLSHKKYQTRKLVLQQISNCSLNHISFYRPLLKILGKD